MSNHEVQPDDTGAVAAQSPATKARRALSALKRELTNEELNSSCTQKLLLDELERLDEQNDSLSNYEEDFHRLDKELTVCKEKQMNNIAAEVISGACLAIDELH